MDISYWENNLLLPALCVACGARGTIECRCSTEHGGPFASPPLGGQQYEPAAPVDLHLREEGHRLSLGEERARLALQRARWELVANEVTFRELPPQSPTRAAAEVAYAAALAAQKTFQSLCRHSLRMYPAICDVCFAHVGLMPVVDVAR
jgi:hypothetical protein